MYKLIKIISILLLFASCKSKVDWTKECEKRFPPRDSISVQERIVHDTSVVMTEKVLRDTIISEKEVIRDGQSVTVRDTIYNTKTVQLPQKTITKTVFRDSTRIVYTSEYREKFFSCEIETEKYKSKYSRMKNLLLFLILLIFALIFVTFLYLRKKLKIM